MNWLLLGLLAAACAALMLLERMGAPVVLNLNTKGDVKRETRFLAQYGQLVCSILCAWIIWQLDPTRQGQVLGLLLAVGIAGIGSMVLKRLLGRVRPGRENAGKFLGFTLRHANWRESFPSSHSASAVAFSVCLVFMFPQAAATWWALALVCAALRYVQDAHWPSDVLAGILAGYLSAHAAWALLDLPVA